MRTARCIYFRTARRWDGLRSSMDNISREAEQSTPGQRLREFRECKNLSREDLARLLKIKAFDLLGWELDRSPVKRINLLQTILNLTDAEAKSLEPTPLLCEPIVPASATTVTQAEISNHPLQALLQDVPPYLCAGTLIKHWRDKEGLSLDEFRRRLGATIERVEKWEKGLSHIVDKWRKDIPKILHLHKEDKKFLLSHIDRSNMAITERRTMAKIDSVQEGALLTLSTLSREPSESSEIQR